MSTPKIIIFDLDDTLIHEGFTPAILCDHVLEVLNFLSQQDIILCIASYNEDATKIIDELELSSYFDQIIGYDCKSKTEQIQQVIEKNPTISPNQIHFFDDLMINIQDCGDLVQCHLVNPTYGIRMQDVLPLFPEVNLYIFDLDDTLILSNYVGDLDIGKKYEHTLGPETDKILQDLKNKNHIIALASYNSDAISLMHKFDILKYFDHAEAYYDGLNKLSHLNRIMDKYPIPNDKIYFFDDLDENIATAHRLGIHGIKIDPNKCIRISPLFVMT
jgi:HAD superfamily phosphatase (TIGR01681 family)